MAGGTGESPPSRDEERADCPAGVDAAMEARRRAIETTGCVPTWRDDKIVYNTEFWGFRLEVNRREEVATLWVRISLTYWSPWRTSASENRSRHSPQIVSDEPSTHIPSTRECGGCTLTGEHCSERVANRC